METTLKIRAPLGNQRLLQTLQAARTPGQWARMLDAHIKADARPGHDNYTVLTLWTQPDGAEGDDAGAKTVVTDNDADRTLLLPVNSN